MKILQFIILIFFIFYNLLLFGQSNMTDTVSREGEVKVFEVVDVNPEPIGGFKEIYLWISKNFDTSELTQMDTLTCIGSVSCKVYVQFTITEEGKMINHKVVKGLGGKYDSLSLATIQKLPTLWKPGLKDGTPVKTRFIIPITFQPNVNIKEKKKRRK